MENIFFLLIPYLFPNLSFIIKACNAFEKVPLIKDIETIKQIHLWNDFYFIFKMYLKIGQSY